MDNLPQVTLKVEGKEVKFLVDSGASRTLIHPEDIPQIKQSTKSILVQGVNGTPVREALSEYVTVEHPRIGMRVTTRVILSTVCPVNLLGRDLMSAMHMSIHAQDTGFTVKVGKELVPHPWDENYYYYSLDAYLKDKITSERSRKWLNIQGKSWGLKGR